MALTALLQQGFGAKLTNHPPGQPLLELQGSPAKVNQVTLESSELLLTQLIPAYVHGVPMRINNFETAMHQLDDLHGGLLSGGTGKWHDGEACKISMLLGYALRACKRKGSSHCYSTTRLRILWERCTDKHGLPTEKDHKAMLAIEGEVLPPTSPLMSLPGFPHSDGEPECGKDAVSDAAAAPDAAVLLITDSDTEPQSVADREPVESPTVETNPAYKHCRLVVPDSAGVESPPVIDHQTVKAIRREKRKQKKQGVIKRPAAASIIKRPAADPSSIIKRPAADPAAPVTPKAAKRDSGPEESQQEYLTYMGRPILEVAADMDPHFSAEFAGNETDVKYSLQREKPIWQVIRNKEILVQTTVGPNSWLRADQAGAAAYTLRMLSMQGHDKASLAESKLTLLRMSRVS